MHTHHAMQGAVLALRTDLLTQIPTILCSPSTLLGVLLPGQKSKLVNRLLSISWLGGSRHFPWRVGVGRQAVSRSCAQCVSLFVCLCVVCVCVCVCVCACVCVCTAIGHITRQASDLPWTHTRTHAHTHAHTHTPLLTCLAYLKIACPRMA